VAGTYLGNDLTLTSKRQKRELRGRRTRLEMSYFQSSDIQRAQRIGLVERQSSPQ